MDGDVIANDVNMPNGMQHRPHIHIGVADGARAAAHVYELDNRYILYYIIII